jgi:asparagine synthase (glutamine-hydrolysing)
VDFVLRLPWSFLCDGQTGKIVFREAVKSWVPEAIYRKPKMGFGPPDASWYRSALKGWIERQLSEHRIRRRGVFRPRFVRKALDDHFGGKRNNVALIWSLLSFESWCRVFGMFGGDLGQS